MPAAVAASGLQLIRLRKPTCWATTARKDAPAARTTARRSIVRRDTRFHFLSLVREEQGGNERIGIGISRPFDLR
jgi:hypothetical protein